jgi:hypothetical protein
MTPEAPPPPPPPLPLLLLPRLLWLLLQPGAAVGQAARNQGHVRMVLSRKPCERGRGGAAVDSVTVVSDVSAAASPAPGGGGKQGQARGDQGRCVQAASHLCHHLVSRTCVTCRTRMRETRTDSCCGDACSPLGPPTHAARATNAVFSYATCKQSSRRMTDVCAGGGGEACTATAGGRPAQLDHAANAANAAKRSPSFHPPKPAFGAATP